MKNLRFSEFECSKEGSVKSGFVELDKIIQGWENGSLTVIAARPAMGKTGFGVSLLRNIAIQNEIPVAFFSLEMSTTQIVRRLLSVVSGIENGKIMAYNDGNLAALSSAEEKKLNEAKKQLENAPIYLDDTPSLSVQEVRARVNQLVGKEQVKLVVIDYLQLMNAYGMPFDNRAEELAVVICILKSLAKNLNIPIIVFSQLNRMIGDVEISEGRYPKLRDFGKFETIEQDADMVCFIHRPEYYQIYQDAYGKDLHGVADIIVAKNRNGKTGDARLKFLGEFSRFENVEQ